MIRQVMLLLLLLAAWVGSPALAQDSGRKVALIISNGSYINAGVLMNPPNDARLVADAARRAGFGVVTLAPNLTNIEFKRTLRDFRNQAQGADVALVYYAGHGIESGGKNWLIPTDAALASDFDLPDEAVDLERVMESIGGARLRVVVLDACRNNPFGKSWRSGSRAVSRGLGQTNYEDVLVIFAAASGQTASDGTGGNSPFATALARRLPEPDLPIQMLGFTVRDDVLNATGGEQRPFVNASITGTPFYLVKRSAAPAAVAAAPAAAPQLSVDTAMYDALAWQGAMGANSRDAFEEYKAQFPQGRFVRLAEQNLQRLRATAAPSPEPSRSATDTAAAQPAVAVAPKPQPVVLARADPVPEPPRPAPRSEPVVLPPARVEAAPPPMRAEPAPRPAAQTAAMPLPAAPTAAVVQAALQAGASAAPVPAGDSHAVADLNRSIQSNNDAILARNRAQQEAYQQALADQKAQIERDREAYARKLAESEAAQARWREQVRACQAGDQSQCDRTASLDKDSLAARQKVDAHLDEVLDWAEGVVLCKPAGADPSLPYGLCQGPLRSVTGAPNEPQGIEGINWACGVKSGVRELGQVAGYTAYGCGYGIHPEDPKGKYPGNRDVAIDLGVGTIPARASFKCPRRQAAFCTPTTKGA